MRRTINTTKLTKDFIESKVSQISIMSKYLNIPIETIQNCIEHNTLIESVFRDDDTTKSMGFTYNKKGRLKVRDFGGFGFFEDIYGTVAYILSLVYDRKIETNNKQDFYFVLKHIAMTFSHLIDGKESDPAFEQNIECALQKSRTRRAIIEVVPRSWNKDDKKLWNNWGISLGYLNTNFVIPVDQYYINRGVDSDPKYYYKTKDPCYAYMLGQDRSGVVLIKLYFPNRNRNIEQKFITNCNVLEGLPNLELYNYDYILITKSSKDRLSIGNHLECHSFYGRTGVKLNIGVINLPSENYKLKEKEYEWLNNKLKPDGLILSLLDFDRTGRQGARYMYETYNIPYLFITRGELGLENFESKDFAELTEKFSLDEINTFIKDTITYVEYKYKEDASSYNSSSEEGLLYDDLPYL